MKETSRARKAFHDYFFMGPKRSLRKLWRKYQQDPNPPTRHLTTIEIWSSAHEWQRRVREMDREIHYRALIHCFGNRLGNWSTPDAGIET